MCGRSRVGRPGAASFPIQVAICQDHGEDENGKAPLHIVLEDDRQLSELTEQSAEVDGEAHGGDSVRLMLMCSSDFLFPRRKVIGAWSAVMSLWEKSYFHAPLGAVPIFAKSWVSP